MKKSGIVSIICAATVLSVLLATFSSGFMQSKSEKKLRHSNTGTAETSEEWFTDTVSTESFDFGENEEWIYLNDLEYTLTDNLKSFLFIGTDHSGNESATDKTYRGTMADFLLVMIINKTEKTYGFIQLNRDTIADVPLINVDGDFTGTAEEQICTAHWYGGSRQQSCLNTLETVSELIGGLPIDGYYSIGMDEIAKLNHIIGGATVTIEDDFSNVDPSLVMGATITLTDNQAYNYLHARMGVGDGENESRMRRQRTYMEAVYDKVIDRVRSQKNFLEDVTDALDESVTTNMNGDDFSQIRDIFREGKDLEIQIPTGTSTVGTKLDDGLEHTEFYVDESSLAEIMILLCNLKIDEFSDWNDLETETEIW